MVSFLAVLASGPVCIVIISLNGTMTSTTSELVMMGFAFLFLGFSAFRVWFDCIVFVNKKCIRKNSDLLPKFEKIQFKCSINYNDIESVAIVASEKNSKNRRISSLAGVSANMPKKYLVFQLINGKKARLFINYFTKKQIVKMLNLVNHNMQQVQNPNTLNIDEIMQDWYTYGGYNREDLKIKRGEKVRPKKTKKK